MANNKFTYQQVHNVSIPKDALEDLASTELSKTDYKVLLMLFTELDGFRMTRTGQIDPENFHEVSIKHIAKHLGITREKVEKSIDLLIDYDYIEKGSTTTIKNGLRFTF